MFKIPSIKEIIEEFQQILTPKNIENILQKKLNNVSISVDRLTVSILWSSGIFFSSQLTPKDKSLKSQSPIRVNIDISWKENEIFFPFIDRSGGLADLEKLDYNPTYNRLKDNIIYTDECMGVYWNKYYINGKKIEIPDITKISQLAPLRIIYCLFLVVSFIDSLYGAQKAKNQTVAVALDYLKIKADHNNITCNRPIDAVFKHIIFATPTTRFEVEAVLPKIDIEITTLRD